MVQEDQEEATRHRSVEIPLPLSGCGIEVVVRVYIVGIYFCEPFKPRDPPRGHQEVVHGAAQIQNGNFLGNDAGI